MKEEKQIERAAMLAYTRPAEQLDADRARAFVSDTIGASRARSGWRRPLIWSVSALAFAGALAAVILIRPNSGSERYGTPAGLSEMTSIHASTDVADTTDISQADTLTVIIDNE